MQRSSGPFRNLMRMHLGLLKVGQRRVTLHQLQWHVGAHNYGLYLQHTLQLAQSSIADFCNVSQTSLVHSITRTSGISQKYSLAVRIEAVLALCWHFVDKHSNGQAGLTGICLSTHMNIISRASPDRRSLSKQALDVLNTGIAHGNTLFLPYLGDTMYGPYMRQTLHPSYICSHKHCRLSTY